ncbi:MAG: hypothetical protein BroJett011_04350 [Chloroflexota bacterium]|nr:MAG: hypothetical protein BroJett011_04350 [Chloroflexota bacterium]
MPKMTAKYSSALVAARAATLSTNGDQEALYQRLNAAGLWWDSKAGEWMNFNTLPANDPTPKLMIRVWAVGDQVNERADDIIKGLRGKFKLIQRSGPYPCRPPQQKESRVYLEFLPDDGQRGTLDEIVRENDPAAILID